MLVGVRLHPHRVEAADREERRRLIGPDLLAHEHVALDDDAADLRAQRHVDGRVGGRHAQRLELRRRARRVGLGLAIVVVRLSDLLLGDGSLGLQLVDALDGLL